MKKKIYWLRGVLIGTVILIIVSIISQFVCADFYRIGPAYPTDQSVCYLFIVSFDYAKVIGIRILFILLCALIGWLYGKNKNIK